MQFIATPFTLRTWDDHIYVYDATDPSTLVYQNTVDSDGSALSLTFNGDYMYVVTNNNLIEIFSVSNPFNPTSQGTYIPGEDPAWVMLQDDYLYISAENTVQIVDISNPVSPVYQGSVLGGPSNNFKRTAIDGLFAYVGGGHLYHCTPMICSLWPPDSPSLVYTFDPYIYGTPADVEVSDGILYMGTIKGLRIYDLY